MQEEKRTQMIQGLSTDAYQKRLTRAHRFEHIEGGGVVKRIERLLITPDIYIPYVLFAKFGLARKVPFPAVLFWGRKIQVQLDDYDALTLCMYGGLHGAELKVAKFFIKNLEQQDVFYDVGANRGFYAFLAIELCKEVHTFEPMKELSDGIAQNVRQGDNIIVNAAALSDSDGIVTFFITDSTMVNTINASVAEALAEHDHGTRKKIMVPSMTLDTYIKTHTLPTYLKIDAEGAEDQIIKGGVEFFTQHVPVIVMEIWGKENKWELSMGAAKRLRDLGYQSFRIDDNGELEKVEGDLSVDVSPQGSENFVFKK